MSYWIYENWTHEKAVLHQASCGYCKNGNGLHGTSGNGNDRWHGPYPSENAALNIAEKLGRKTVNFCGTCSKIK